MKWALFLAVPFLMVALSPLTGDPTKVDLQENLLPPCLSHPFGTDHLGRDVLSRVVHAAKIDLVVSMVIVVLSAGIGTILGLISGYYGGYVDKIIVGLIDVFLALPELILALVIVGALGPGLLNCAIALIALGWVRYARVVRASTLSLKERTFIEVTKAIGESDVRIIFTHILPNVFPVMTSIAVYHLGHSILSLASLGFLGLGAQPPLPEWGMMLNEGRFYIRSAWWTSVFPGIAIVATVFAFLNAGNFIQEYTNPKLRRVLNG